MTSNDFIKYSKQKKLRSGAYVTCKKCGKEFYVFRSRLKKANPQYCSVKCYDKLGEHNPNYGKSWSKKQRDLFYSNPNRPKFKSDPTNPNKIRFVDNMDFWGSTIGWYKKYLPIRIGRCEMCGFNDVRILQIHHKDKNRKNNTRENIILLCPNCHALEHWKDSSGVYKWRFTGNPNKRVIKNIPRGKHGNWIK